MPRVLLFEQVFEAARGLFQVVFCRVLYRHDCVVADVKSAPHTKHTASRIS
jgi:hypothetical protein